MATVKPSIDGLTPSFAKVVASSPQDGSPSPSTLRAAATRTNPHPANLLPAIAANGRRSHIPSPGLKQKPVPSNPVDTVVTQMMSMKLMDNDVTQNMNGSSLTFPERPKSANRDSGSDDSQRADSTSDLDTKPPSLDGKSITSGTTFALDEKESLRPDDSASVKAAAAVEDDDAFSIRGSLLAGSRTGSDIAAKRGTSVGGVAGKQPTQMQNSNQDQMALDSQSGSGAAAQIPGGAAIPLASVAGPTDAMQHVYRQHPDEKLLEAMQSTKDRMFLLRLEKEVISFVQDSKEPYMDFPPYNSFCRLLTHKLADYYHMTHSYEHNIGSVRIFRTPFCRVPPSLATIVAASAPTESTTPPTVMPRKIMRRGEDGELALSSASQSMATSEVGSDLKEKQAPAKEKLTREEREEAYNRARELIFGSSEKYDEGENGISRASSMSAREKSAGGRRGKAGKQRRDSGSFESRAQYAPFWAGQQPTWISQPQYAPIPNPPPYAAAQPPFTNQIPPIFSGQPQTYPAMVPAPPYPQYSGATQCSIPPSQHRFAGPPANAPGPVYPPGPPMMSSVSPQQSWQPTFNPGVPYPAHQPPPQPPRGTPPGPGVPYAYGQLPSNLNPHDPKSQHPIPGSYRGHAFNPKTQSFVPMVPPPTGAPMAYPQPSSHQGSPQVPSPHLAYAAGFQQGMIPPAQHYGPPSGYPMARQGSSSSSIPGYHGSPRLHPHSSLMPPVPQHGGPQAVPPPHSVHNLPPHPSHQIPNKPPTVSQSTQQIGTQLFSHLPHYGNPATLPQKPT